MKLARFDSMTWLRILPFISVWIAPRVFTILSHSIADVKEEALMIVWEELQRPTRASPSKSGVQTCSIVTERELKLHTSGITVIPCSFRKTRRTEFN